MTSSTRHTTGHERPMPKPIARKRPMTLWLGYALIAFALLSFFYGGLAWLGIRAGTAEKAAVVAAETNATLTRQLELAEQDFNDGNHTLTERRLDYILSVDPTNSGALELQDRNSSAQMALLVPVDTPTPMPTATPLPTPTPSPVPPTPDPAEAEAAREEAWATLQANLPSYDVDEQIQQLEIFRAQYPGLYNRESGQLLYDAYLSRGTDLMRGNAVERGILLLTKARNLKDLPDELEGEIYWAEQYVAGISYYSVNWDLYLSYFRPLCQFARYYQDSCSKLIDGLAAAAAQAYDGADWCTAAVLYNEIRTVDPNAQIKGADLLARASETTAACGEPLENVPTPGTETDIAPGAPLPTQGE